MGNTIQLSAADGHRLAAYRADPTVAMKGALVVVQEIFGVNEHIRRVCDGFADDGYLAIAPALFDRVEPGLEFGYESEDVARGREIRAQIDWDEAVADCAAAVEATGGDAVGVVGYCWGGSLAWLAAARLPVAASVAYYGGQIVDFLDDTPNCPIQLHFGDSDSGIPLTDVDNIRARHAAPEINIYAAGHGFNCDLRSSFDAESAALARRRTMEFFLTHLG